MRALLLLALSLVTACAATYQSAHTLAPGKTQVAADITGVKAFAAATDSSNTVTMGEVMVRHGLDDGIDGGIRFSRLPGGDSGSTASQLVVDIKKRLAESATSTVSLDVPAGVAWEETNLDFRSGILGVTPTLLLGLQIAPTTELVLGPKFVLLFNPEAENNKTVVGIGASLGIRFSDAARTYGVQPELGILKIQDAVLFTFGVAVAAGN